MFGIYLCAVSYTHLNFIGSFDEASRRSGIYVNMQEGLDKFARCATGSVAPAITGIDLKGNSVSLNDFKGKYLSLIHILKIV